MCVRPRQATDRETRGRVIVPAEQDSPTDRSNTGQLQLGWFQTETRISLYGNDVGITPETVGFSDWTANKTLFADKWVFLDW